MHIELRATILASELPTDLDKFFRDRMAMLSAVADAFRRFEPTFDDAALVFRGLEPSERVAIENFSRSLPMEFAFAATPVYSEDEIRRARFVPLLIAGDEVDRDSAGRILNCYPRRVCDACGNADLTAVPKPYIITRPSLPNDLFNAANGLRIVSTALMAQIQYLLKDWVKCGAVAYAEEPSRDVNDAEWMMPLQSIGPYINSVVIRTCPVCKQATEVRRLPANDPLLRNMDVVSFIPQTDAPIALIGSWHGQLRPDKPVRVSWDVVISGELHAELVGRNVAGLVPADRVIHTEDELDHLLGRERSRG